MICMRCGQGEVVTDILFIVGFNDNPELAAGIVAQLRAQGIDGIKGMSQLCDGCRQAATAAIQEAARVHAAAHRGILLQHCEANLGRPLTPEERKVVDGYLDGANGVDTPSTR